LAYLLPAERSMAKSRRKTEQAAASPQEGAPPYAGDTTAASIERERVAQRAYELYLARGGGDGQAMDDWLSAERELAGRVNAP